MRRYLSNIQSQINIDRDKIRESLLLRIKSLLQLLYEEYSFIGLLFVSVNARSFHNIEVYLLKAEVSLLTLNEHSAFAIINL